MAALEILALDTATPQIEAPQTGDTYSAPRAVSIAPESLTGTSATTSLDITQTWNTTGTPTAVRLNVTDTASNAASLLMDLRTGGTTRFYIGKNMGAAGVGLGGGINGNGTPQNGFVVNAGLGLVGNNSSALSSGAISLLIRGSALIINSTTPLSWGDTNAVSSDLILARDAANILAQRNTTNAQTFRVYNTFTDASNYERGKMAWESNLLVIGTEAAGSGTSRRIRLSSGNGEIAFGAGTNDEFGVIGSVFRVTASNAINWSSLDNNVNSGFDDLGLSRSAAGILVLTNGSTGGGSLELREQTAPAAPAANNVRIYAEDNGSGKTRLMALFNTGAAVQIAIEP